MVLIYVQRRDIRFIGQSMLKMKLPGKRKNKKTIEKIHRYSEGGHAESWCGRRGCQGEGQIVADNLFREPLKGAAEKSQRSSRLEPNILSFINLFIV